MLLKTGLMEVEKMEEMLFETAKNEKWDICIYGLGYLGKKLYKSIPSIFGFEAKYYCDSDNEKVDKKEHTGMIGIYKEELLRTDRPMLIFILVDDPYDLQIMKELSINSNLITVSLRELVEMDYVKEKFFGRELYAKYLKLDTMNV